MLKFEKDTIARYVRSLKENSVTPNEIKRKLSSINRFIKWTVTTGYLEQNDFKQISIDIANQVSSYQLFVNGEEQKEREKIASIPNDHYPITNNFSNIQNYIAFAVVLLLISLIGFGLYNQFFKKTATPFAYPAALTPGSRIISFQGRLTDSLGNPIIAPIDLTYKFYTVSTGGSPITGSTRVCTGSPDQDGVFANLIGSDPGPSCTPQLPATIFSENPNVWLGVTVGSELTEMSPRQQIANVGYAMNAETLQGFPPGTTVSTIPFISTQGDLLIAAATPGIRSTYTTANFVISSAKTTTIQSANAGDIVLSATDGGALRFNTYNGSLVERITVLSGGNVGISNVNPRAAFDVIGSASLSANLAFSGATTQIGQLNGGNISFATSPGGDTGLVTKMTLTNLGNVGIGSTLPAYLIDVSGGSGIVGQFSGRVIGGNAINNNEFTTLGQIAAGGGQYWQRANGALSPATLADDVLLGATSTSSAKFAFMNVFSGTPTASISGNLAIAAPSGINPATSYDILNGGSFNLRTSPGGDAGLASRLFVNNAGNVGIGTTGPSEKLQVQGNIRAQTGILFDDGVLGMRDTGSNIVSWDAGSAHPNGYRFTTATVAAGAVEITNAGNVGIGTTAPLGKLHVADAALSFSGTRGTFSDDRAGITVASNNFRGFVQYSQQSNTSHGSYGLTFIAADASNPTVNYKTWALQPGHYNTTGARSGLLLAYGANTANPHDLATNVMKWDESGNVGIGTTSPLAKLDLAGDASASGNLTLRGTGTAHLINLYDNGSLQIGNSVGGGTATSAFVVTSVGNIGIGTTTPLAKLELATGNIAAAAAGFSTGAPTLVSRFDGPKPDETDFTGNPNGGLGQAATVTGGVIHRPGKFGKGVQIAEATTNLVTNPSFETDTTGWSAVTAGGGSLISRVATESAILSNSLNFKSDTSGNAARFSVTLSAATTYTLTAYLKGSGNVNLMLVDNNGPVIGSTSVTLSNTWIRYSTSITTSVAPSGTYLDIRQNGAGTVNAFIDAVQVEQKAYATPYADGSLGNGHSWSGTAHASTSSRTATTFTYPQNGNLDAKTGIGTVGAWFYTTSASASRFIVGSYGGSDYFALYVNSSNALVGSWGSVSTAASGGSVTANAWHYAAMTSDGTTLTLYLNGVSVGSGSVGTHGTIANIGVGYESYNGNSWINGLIDDFAIFPSALSAQEIYSIYKSNAPIQTEDKSSVLTAGEILPVTSGGVSKLILAGSVAGNVGIGTTSPLEKLDITGNASMSGNLTIGQTGVLRSQYGPLNLAYKSGLNTWATGITLQDTTGNVGIGTSSPSPTNKLHVEGQCVTGDTLLRRRRKKLKGKSSKGKVGGGPDPEDDEWEDMRIDEVEIGDEILTLDESTGEFVPQKVEKLMDMGKQEVFGLKTSTGKWIKTTANHPYLVQVAPPKYVTGTFEVDISGRIEEMNKDSFIALANNQASYTIKFSAREKRILKAIYRERKPFSKFGYQIYAHLIHELILFSGFKVTSLRIDHDYKGNEREIEAILRIAHPTLQINFISVGKKSPAHNSVYEANTKGLGIDTVLSTEVYLANRSNKKGTQVALKGTADATDHQEWIPGFPSHRVPSSMYHKDKKLSSSDLFGKTKWLKVADLHRGVKIATVDGWEYIIDIVKMGKMQTYDIQVANTHNFVGNDIVAHNTYISGNVGIGSLTPTTFKLEVAGNIGPDADNIRNIGAVGRAYNTIYVNNIVGSGGLGYWSRGTGVLFPTTTTDGVAATTSATTVATFTASGTNDALRTGGVSNYLTVGSTGSLTFNAVTNDIVTGTNEHLALMPNGTGNVGISTTSPLEKLDIAGSATLSGNLTIGQTGVLRSQYGPLNLAYKSGLGTWATGFTLQDTTGNVGIGTTGPGAKLEVSGNVRIGAGSANSILSLLDANSSNYYRTIYDQGSRLYFENTESGGGFYFNGNSGGTDYFETANIDIFNINSGQFYLTQSSGNIGIGTTTPLAKLDVNGTASISGALTLYGTPTITSTALQTLNLGGTTTGNIQLSAGSATPAFVLTTAGQVGIGTTGPNAPLHVVGRVIGSNLVVGPYAALNDITGIANTLQFGNYATASLIDQNSADAYLYKASAVIGSMAAQTLIFQTRSDADGGGFAFVSGNTPSAKVYIEGSSGNVGIGTTGPTSSLHVVGTPTNHLSQFVYNGSTNGTAAVYASTAGGGGSTYYAMYGTATTPGTNIAGYFTASGGTNNYALITGSGNVGIGTTSPTALLDVRGNATFSGTLSIAPMFIAAAGTCNISSTGKIYYDATLNQYYFCNGTIWTAMGGGVSSLQGAYDGGNTILTTTARDIAFTLAAGLGTPTSLTLTNNHVSNTTDFSVINANASGTNTNGILVNQTGAGTLTNGINITRTAGTLTNGLALTGTFTNLISAPNFSVTNAGLITGVGVNSGSGLIQGIGGLTITGTTNINATGTSATNIGNSTGILTLVSGGASGWTNTSGNLTLSTATSGHIILSPFGNVGIGTTGPSDKLQVAAGNTIVGLGEFQGANLLYNGGAEDGATGWTSRDFGVDASTGSGTSESNAPLSGSNNFHAANDGGMNQAVELVPGAVYTLSARVRVHLVNTPGDASQGQLVVGTTAAGREVVDAVCNPNDYDVTPNLNKWVLCSATFTATNTADVKTVTMYVGFRAAGNTHSTDFDNLMLVRGGLVAGYNPITTFVGSNGATAITGNVGIGTTSPGSPLQIDTSSNSNINLIGATVSRSGGSTATTVNRGIGIVFKDADNPTLVSGISGIRDNPNANYNGSLAFFTYASGAPATTFANMTEAMRINSAGNVGIGTTGPGAKLHLYDSTATSDLPSLKLDSTYIAGDSTGLPMNSIYFANSGTNVNAIQSAERTLNNYALDFQTYNGASLGTRMTILGSGNVGIGTTTPGHLLTLSTATGGEGIGIYSTNVNDVRNWLIANSYDGWGDLSFRESNAQYGNPFSAGTTRFVLQKGGNVGIGSTAPTSKLDIVGNLNVQGYATASASLSIGSYNAMGGVGNGLFSGNVGIGTTNATSRFFVNLGANQLARFNDGTNASGATFQNGSILSQSSQFQIAATSTNPLSFYTGATINSMTPGTERIRVATTGNVGIGGALNTNAQLDLNGGTILAGQFCPTSTCLRYVVPNGISRIDQLQVASDLPNNTGYISFLDANNSYVKIASISAQATGTVVIDNSATNITDVGYPTVPDLCVGDPYWCTGKIDAGTIDPPYTINGKKYATFLSAMTGVKEETTGTISTKFQDTNSNFQTNPNNQYPKGYAVKVIDFNDLPEASDLWLFSKTTNLRKNLGKMTVLLTPSDDTRTWYKVDNATHSLTIYSSRPTTISYRLTAPRFDGERWTNRNPGGSGGFELNDPDRPSLVALNQAGNVPPETFTILPISNDQLPNSNFQTNPNNQYPITNIYKIISNKTGDLIEEVGVFAQITAGQIKAGFIETENAIVNNILFAKNIIVQEKIISPVVETTELKTDIIKPKNDDLTINLAPSDATKSTASVDNGALGRLIIKGLNNKTVASIDSAGNATFAGTLTAQDVVASSSSFLTSDIGHLTTGDASISGKLIAREIESDTINIIQAELAQIKNNPLPNAAYYQNIGSNVETQNFASLQTNSLIVTNNANLYNASVANSLTAGNIFIQNNEILSLSWELKLSALAQITLFDGSVTIAKNGNITTEGQVIAKGGVRTDTIQPTENSKDVTFKLPGRTEAVKEADVTSAGKTAEVNGANGKLKIENSVGNEVASIDASGSAKFNALGFNQIATNSAIIADSGLRTANDEIIPAMQTNAEAAGQGILPLGAPEIIIYNDKITKDSLVYLTKTGDTGNEPLTVVKKESGERPYFSVSAGNSQHPEIRFNWLIIN